MLNLPKPRFEICFTNYTKETEFVRDTCTQEEIETCLAQTEHDECRLSLQYIYDGGSQSLELDSENGEYRILFFPHKGSYYTYLHPHRPKKEIYFSGDRANNQNICDDFNVIKEVFRQFVEDKTVSRDLLQY